MKLLKSPLMLKIYMILILLSIGIVLFLFLNFYQTTNNIQKVIKIKNIINTIKVIEAERINTIEYIIQHSDNQYKKLLKMQHDSNKELSKLPQSKLIVNIKNRLDLIHKQVEYEEANKKIIFEYQTGVILPLNNTLKSLCMEVNDKSILDTIDALDKLMLLRINTELENALVYYHILSYTPLDKKEQTIYKRIIQQDKLIDVIKIAQDNTKGDLSRYNSILANFRGKIIQNKIDKIDSDEWLDAIAKKEEYIMQTQNSLLNQLSQITKNKNSMYLYYLIATIVYVLLAVVAFIKILKLHKVERQKKYIDKETQKDIKVIFDEDEQKELKKLINQGSVGLVYKFFIKAIKNANETKELFLASMSHEIRTPLNGIFGFTQLLEETNLDNKQYEYTSIIKQSSEHLLAIVNEILDISKIKADKMELEIIEFDPISQFEVAIESYAPKASQNQVELNLFVDPKLPTHIMGDPTRISQVLINLVSNAIAYTPPNGEVNVDIKMVEETSNSVKIRFSVKDNGVGISPQQQKKIFEAFSQANMTISRKYGGTGLGLNISSKLVKMMGSKIELKSELSKGSEFYFVLDMQKSQQSKQRVIEQNDYNVFIIGNEQEKESTLHNNLAEYIASTGANIFSYDKSLFLKILDNKEMLPDIIFIDYQKNTTKEELDRYMDLSCKVVIVISREYKDKLKEYEKRIDKIIYKPLNFTKTINTINQLDKLIAIKQKDLKFDNLKFLIVDDNPINRKLIKNLLNKINIGVQCAENGKEAVEMIVNMHDEFDMIFMDIQMPIMDGIEASAKIISYERYNDKKHIPIIALTANTFGEDKARYESIGINGHLSKPIEVANLYDILIGYFEDRLQ
jgi:signal transduction histidine kinase/CheY-like chemotaxis protein